MLTVGALGGWIDGVLLLGAGVARIAAAFLLIPAFAPDTVPALVRNSIFVALGLVSLSVQPPLAVAAFSAGEWLRLLSRELFVGLAIGFFFGTLLWALETAGQIIDTKAGATTAQIVDPLSGHQTSLTGAFLGRLANLVFMFSGGLSLLAGVLLESYALYPLAPEWPTLLPQGVRLFELEFARLMVLATLFAAPVVTALYVVDAGLGLMNRFAEQLNVFQLGMALKTWLATFLLLLILGTVVEAVVLEMQSRRAVVLKLLREVI